MSETDGKIGHFLLFPFLACFLTWSKRKKKKKKSERHSRFYLKWLPKMIFLFFSLFISRSFVRQRFRSIRQSKRDDAAQTTIERRANLMNTDRMRYIKCYWNWFTTRTPIQSNEWDTRKWRKSNRKEMHEKTSNNKCHLVEAEKNQRERVRVKKKCQKRCSFHVYEINWLNNWKWKWRRLREWSEMKMV